MVGGAGSRGGTADVHLVPADDFRRIAAGVPFGAVADDPSRLLVSFLDRPLDPLPARRQWPPRRRGRLRRA
ncbi:hypothetical protein [Clavibacter michiganensis]|uniref:hypothetical protein n=1 Tax=Clavibacter michiganensis TaxID=28447 RepID=UPI00292D436F|nr:hypothetical protein [Clavibacter michiganensis]